MSCLLYTSVPPSGMPQQPNGAVVPPNRAPEQPKAPYAQPYQAEPDGAGETTLLDSGAGETTLLNGAGSAYPVSYTHLDVYKRQACMFRRIRQLSISLRERCSQAAER